MFRLRNTTRAMAAVAILSCATGTPTLRAQATEEAVTLVRPGVTLHGTLEIPAGGGRHDVALIIAGSGPTDRNGNSPLLKGANNSLKMLADGLAARGIATLRYDKRAIGESKPDAACVRRTCGSRIIRTTRLPGLRSFVRMRGSHASS